MKQPDKRPTGARPILMLLDGHALVFRSWYGIRQPLTVRSTGEEVKGVYGFTNTFLRMLRQWNPTYCAIAFDPPGPTFRHLQYAEYKAQREAPPPELHQQIAYAHRLMEAFRVPIYEVEGYEADDVLGTLAHQGEQQGMEVVIVTGDTDTLQLVTPAVRVDLHYRIQESKTFDEAAVRERFGGLDPAKQPELKALQGDASDNIPGVPGIGQKTAIKLIQEFASLEGVYENIELVQPRLRAMLLEFREQAFLSRELGRIVDVPLTMDEEACRFWQYDRREVVEFLRSLDFFSIVDRIPEGKVEEVTGASAPAVTSPVHDYQTVTTSQALGALVEELRRADGFALAVQASSSDPMQAELAGIAFAVAPRQAWYVPIGHQQGERLPLKEALEALKGVLEDPSLAKVAHNGNFETTLLLSYGIQVQNLASDTMVAAHLANRKALTLNALALDVLGEEMAPIASLLGTGSKRRSMAEVSGADLTPYAAASADLTWRLRSPLEEEARQKGGWDVYTQAELPLIPVLAQMQRNGIALDTGVLQEMSEDLGQQLQALEAAIYEDADRLFNVNSPQQLSKVLFSDLGLPKTKHTRTGAYTTDAAALEGLLEGDLLDVKQRHLIESLLKHRELAKLKSTYVDALPTLVNPETGRLHTTYNQCGSATGRVSSNDPNLQNIPVRTPLGQQVRRAFIAQEAPGWLLLAADYSQIELRVLAHLSGDPVLIAAFSRDEDIHAATASQMYQVPLDGVTPDMRRIAKVLNFGVIYGLSAFGVSRQMGIKVDEGAQFIEGYFERYPGIRQYVEETREKVRSDEYVETLLGRRRYLPEITSANIHVRQAAERMAINMPVQGTAAEVVKLAMVRIHRWMEERRVRSRMLLQVHDELIFEVPGDELEEMKGMVTELMPAAMEMVVPLKVDLKQGETWGDMG